ncbi:MAG: prepilin-type N-terminal cleavage/methylation domain-containing protein [Geminicoccaceae bacterium]
MSRAGAAEQGFTLLELLVVLALLALALGIALPRLPIGRTPGAEKVAGLVAAKVKDVRSAAMRTGTVGTVDGAVLALVLPKGMRLQPLGGGPIVFMPNGMSSGGGLEISGNANDRAAVIIERLTGRISVRRD